MGVSGWSVQMAVLTPWLAVPLPPPGAPFDPGEVYLSQGRFLRFYFGDGWVGAACGLELPPPDIVWIEADALNENR